MLGKDGASTFRSCFVSAPVHQYESGSRFRSQQFTSQHFLLLFKFPSFYFALHYFIHTHTVNSNICALYWSGSFSQSVYVYFTWGPVTWGCHQPPLCICTMYKVRLYVQCTNNRDIEKTSGQAAQFHIWTIWSMDRTSAHLRWTWVCSAVILWNSSLCTYENKINFCSLSKLPALATIMEQYCLIH